MNTKQLKLLFLFMLIINFFLNNCVSNSLLRKNILKEIPHETEKKEVSFKKIISVDVPIKILDDQVLNIHTDISRPEQKISPKTLVIIVPGSGNVSRRGESSGDGIDVYEKPIELNSLWSEALSNNGYFVLSYDKRTCAHQYNKLCANHPTDDINKIGIKALRHDLDQIYNYAESKLSLGAQIILMSTTQGAQVIANSQAASKANAIILVSPLAGNLEKTWVQGLYKAHKQKTNFDSKNRILNEAESTQALFNSLKNGKIAANTHVFGASLTFWQSWLASSEMTIRDLALTEKPVLILTSTNDVFSAYEHIINNKFYIKNKRNFIITNISNSERNFINNNKLQEQAVTEVVNFIKNLSTKSSKISGNS